MFISLHRYNGNYSYYIHIKSYTTMAKKIKTHQLRHVVCVSNNKGGAGKTSTVLNLAAAIARRIEGYRVLVIDCDPQRNLSYFLGWDDRRELEGSPTLYTALCQEQQGLPVYRAGNGIFYTPASVNLNGIDAILSLRPNPSKALKEILQRHIDCRCSVDGGRSAFLPSSLSEAFDFIFIDTQPAMSRVTVNVICAATGIIIPVELEPLAVDGYVKTIGKIMKIKKVSNPALQIHGVLLTKKDSRLNSANSLEELLRDEGDVFKTTIRRTNDVPSSQDRDFDPEPGICHDIFSYRRKRGHADEDFIALADEYLKRWGK